MKKIVQILIPVFLLLLMILPSFKLNAHHEFTGAVWFSYLDFSTYLKDKNEKEFTKSFNEICENVKELKMNTLIVHVRAFQDAIYPSEQYPIASWISSASEMDYDALELMIKIAHKHNLIFEAWINPYRVSNNTIQSKAFLKNNYQFDEDELIIYTSDHEQRIILDPSSSSVQRKIIKGVKEIIENYDVDGIHFDDYFYQPGTYGKTTVNKRQKHVNNLIKKVYQTIKEEDEQITFGISPQGNLENARYDGADIDTWLSRNGYVDYVMPQIYWTDFYGDGNTTMFTNRMKDYQKLWKNKNVSLKAGLALYFVDQKPTSDPGWSIHQDNITNQIQSLNEAGWNGFSLFRYADLLKNSTKQEINHMKIRLETLSGNPVDEIKGWILIDNTWYFHDYKTGIRKTGWIADGKNWYFLDYMNGSLYTNSWISQDASGKIWYYVDENGAMVSDTWIEGYYIDHNGICYND